MATNGAEKPKIPTRQDKLESARKKVTDLRAGLAAHIAITERSIEIWEETCRLLEKDLLEEQQLGVTALLSELEIGVENMPESIVADDTINVGSIPAMA